MTNAAQLYLRLLKRCLTRDLFPDGTVDKALQRQGHYDRDKRHDGSDWPSEAETMVGMKRLDNLEACIASAIQDGIEGDLVETGVWRGGCGILMRGVLAALGEPEKTVWLADSFEGLPEADPERFPQDRGDRHVDLKPYLAVSLDQVKENLRRYELLDHRVRFLPGWFRDTLPTAPMEKISVLRLDGDMYESTYVALESLYPRVTPGGYVIVDDYGALPNCKAAIDDYRRANGITEPILEIDWTGVYWRRFF
jgi:O-methyltransferase